MRKNFKVLGTVFALALAVTAGCAATGGTVQSSVTPKTQAETAVEPGKETAAGGAAGERDPDGERIPDGERASYRKRIPDGKTGKRYGGAPYPGAGCGEFSVLHQPGGNQFHVHV